MVQTSQENPLFKARQTLGLSRVELSARAGIALYTLYMLERASKKTINAPLLSYFSSKGIDADELQREYAEYRKALQAL